MMRGTWQAWTTAALAAVTILLAGGNLATPAEGATRPAAQLQVAPKVQVTLQALDRLHSYGYSVNTAARADKAIRHWQKVNGLAVDGIVGPLTLGSLGLSAGSGAVPSSPAARLDPPAPNGHSAGPGDVEAIIRDVWPDDLEDEAVRIAKRESSLVPTARNSCCFGLMQIHWRAHRSWLAQFGVTSSDQLLDARTNVEMGYQLYLIDGWGPWDT